MLCDVCDHYSVHLKHSAICHISVKLEEEKRSKQTHFLKSKRTSLSVQWLRPLTSNAEGMGLIPEWRTKIPQAMQHSKKKKSIHFSTQQIHLREFTPQISFSNFVTKLKMKHYSVQQNV